MAHTPPTPKGNTSPYPLEEAPHPKVEGGETEQGGDITETLAEAAESGQRALTETRRRAGEIAGDVTAKAKGLASDARKAARDNRAAVGIGAAIGVGALAAVAAVFARRGDDGKTKAPAKSATRKPAARKAATKPAEDGSQPAPRKTAQRGAAKSATPKTTRARKAAKASDAATAKPATKRAPRRTAAAKAQATKADGAGTSES